MTSGVSFPYDASIADAVRSTPRTIPDVIGILRSIDRICSPVDGLKWFNWLYLQVTLAVEGRVTSGGFTDVSWIAALDVQFAALYLSALQTSLAGETPPECWQVLFGSRDRPELARIQFALAGINAHINRDLAVAIVATCEATGVTPDRSGIHYADYTALNSTLDGLIETAKKTLNVRLPGDALPPVSHLEDTIAAWSVSAAREAAWKSAEHLWTLRSAPLLRTGFLDVLDGFTTVVGKALLVPVP